MVVYEEGAVTESVCDGMAVLMTKVIERGYLFRRGVGWLL